MPRNVSAYQIRAQWPHWKNKLEHVDAASFAHAREQARARFGAGWLFRIEHVDSGEAEQDPGFDPTWEEDDLAPSGGPSAFATEPTPAPVPMTRDTPIAWVDIETTATDSMRHAILSIGVVRSDGQEREWYVLPSRRDIAEASPRALEVNGYTPEIWAARGQQIPHKVATEFAAFVDGHILGAHNATFDVPFIRAFCGGRGHFAAVTLNVPHRPLCTVSMLWPLVLRGDLESPSHEKACNHFGIPIVDHHSALADARRAQAIYEAIMRVWIGDANGSRRTTMRSPP